MSILGQAIELEERAETFYLSSKKGVEDRGALTILDLLAAEERKHANALRAVASGEQAPAEDIESDLLGEARTLIAASVEGGAVAVFSDASMEEILRTAMEIEQSTQAFYREHAEEAATQAARELLVDLAEREQQHYLLVSSLAEYFARPQAWVEAAEFGLRPDAY